MKLFRFIAFLVLVIFAYCNMQGQSVLDRINEYEKAVFTITSYKNDGSADKAMTGFFISPDGIAVAPASVFIDLDSMAVTLRKGKSYRIERLLSTHKMANLALFKVFDHRKKGFDYIIPSQNSTKNLSEVLIISDPRETEEGITFGNITEVFQAPFLDRIIMVDAKYGSRTCGAPVINNQGELIGIAGHVNRGSINYFLSTQVLNDTLWVNHSFNNWKKSVLDEQKNTLYPYMSDGIVNYLKKNWIEAAKDFSSALNIDTTNIGAHILRSECRRGYENYLGMEDDISIVDELYPNYFLKDYFDARNLYSKGDKQNAYLKYNKCIKEYDSYSPALIEFGLLSIELKKDVDTALKCFNKAIESSPMYANGYYERSRLLHVYFNEQELAIDDINKAIVLNRLLPGAYSIRGTLKIQIGDYLDAIADFDRALQIDANDTHALFNRGLSYYNLGMKEKSCQDWEAAGQKGHYKSIKYISRYCSKIASRRVAH